MNRYNSIDELSEGFREFLYRPENLNLLPECGWLDGGCRSLMTAIRLWLGTDITTPYQIVKEEQEAHSQHVIAKVGKYFIDGDGISITDDLIDRWLYIEKLPRVILRSFDPNEEPNDTYGEEPFYIDDNNIITLVQNLDNEFNKENVLTILSN